MIKNGIKKLLNKLVSTVGKTSLGQYLYNQIILNQMKQIQKVEHNGLSLLFTIPNALNRFRTDTFSTKEPETLEWIDNMPDHSVVWDIGANVGLYSCYAALQKDCKVYAFEPSVFNLELLARNIFLNKIKDKVTIIPLAVSDKLDVAELNMTSTEWGGALSTFGQSYGYDGEEMHKIFDFKTLGISMEDAVSLLKLPAPDFIKMDVDGIEHLILKGGIDLLKQVSGVLIEINDEFSEQSTISAKCLTDAGLTMVNKKHSQMVEESIFNSAFNQIWSRT